MHVLYCIPYMSAEVRALLLDNEAVLFHKIMCQSTGTHTVLYCSHLEGEEEGSSFSHTSSKPHSLDIHNTKRAVPVHVHCVLH